MGDFGNTDGGYTVNVFTLSNIYTGFQKLIVQFDNMLQNPVKSKFPNAEMTYLWQTLYTITMVSLNSGFYFLFQASLKSAIAEDSKPAFQYCEYILSCK